MLMSFLTTVAGILLVSCASFTYPAAVLTSNGYNECQAEYSQLVGNLVASEGTGAVATLWRLLFNQLDLNEDNKVGAAELVISLETHNLLSQVETEKVYSSIHQLITEGSDDRNQDLDQTQFKDIVGSRLGRPSIRPISAPYTYLCKYLTEEATDIISYYQNFTRNVVNAKEYLRNLVQKSELAEAVLKNIWEGIFKSMDVNKDEKISLSDLLQINQEYNKNENELENIFDNEENSMEKQEFFSYSKDLLYRTDGFVQNIEKIKVLKAWSIMSWILANMIGTYAEKHDQSVECKTEYQKTLIKYLAADKSFSSSYLFTVFDSKKDGVLDFTEISQTVGTLLRQIDYSFATIAQQEITSFDIRQFKYYLPDNVVNAVATTESNEAPMELSKLSINEHESWRSFCEAVTLVVSRFPSVITQPEDSDSIEVIINPEESKLDLDQPSASNELDQTVSKISHQTTTEIGTESTTTNYAEDESATTQLITHSAKNETTTIENDKLVENYTAGIVQTATEQTLLLALNQTEPHDEEKQPMETTSPTTIAQTVTTETTTITTEDTKEVSTFVAEIYEDDNSTTISVLNEEEQLEKELAGLVREIIQDMKNGEEVPESVEETAEFDVEQIEKVDETEGDQLNDELQQLFIEEKSKSGNKMKNLSVEEEELLKLLDDGVALY